MFWTHYKARFMPCESQANKTESRFDYLPSNGWQRVMSLPWAIPQTRRNKIDNVITLSPYADGGVRDRSVKSIPCKFLPNDTAILIKKIAACGNTRPIAMNPGKHIKSTPRISAGALYTIRHHWSLSKSSPHLGAT